MHYFEVAPVKIIRSNVSVFTYSSENNLKTGQIVMIEIGKQTMPGVVIKKTIKPTYATKEILVTIEQKPLPTELLKLANWISEYYATPLALVLQSILPTNIHKTRKKTQPNSIAPKRKRTNYLLNSNQEDALNKINNCQKGTFLVHGITGSGKTALYLAVAKDILHKRKSVIIIVPEIALTPQLVSEFSNQFENIIVTHSKMTESNRHAVWKKCLNSVEPLVVIGPRSALFMPLNSIGAVVIDEAHENSLNQDKSPKYSALRVSTILGRLHNSKVIFGSATPNVLDMFLAEKTNSPILKLKTKARDNSRPPDVKIIDIKKRNNFNKHYFISDQLMNSIENNLRSNKQTLIFHNRRGSSSTTLCHTCGWVSECPNCHVPLILHADNYNLRCHICSRTKKVNRLCPECGDSNIVHKGIGTKLIESELNKIFTHAKIARFDTDNKASDGLDKRYQELYDNEIDIIIGTQIIAKGLDLPNLKTVGVIQADSGLNLPDYTAHEKTFQLLAQVVGRVGRDEQESNVIIQTYQPDHPIIVFGASQNYKDFYEYSLAERNKANFPPFSYILKLTCTCKTEATVIKNVQKISTLIKNYAPKEVTIFGPSPAFREREKNNYRWQLIVKSSKRKHLLDLLAYVPKSNWQFELDSTSLL